MCPDAVIAVGFVEELHHLEQTFRSLLTGDEAALHSDYNCHHAKAGTADRRNFQTVVAALTRQAGFGMGKIPEITEGLFLDKGHQLVVGQFGTIACNGDLQRGGTDQKKK